MTRAGGTGCWERGGLGVGRCDTDGGTCVCEVGWSGRACDSFRCSNAAGIVTLPVAAGGGEVVVRAAVGGDYGAQSGCAWQIAAADGRSVVQARITSLEVPGPAGGWGGMRAM